MFKLSDGKHPSNLNDIDRFEQKSAFEKKSNWPTEDSFSRAGNFNFSLITRETLYDLMFMKIDSFKSWLSLKKKVSDSQSPDRRTVRVARVSCINYLQTSQALMTLVFLFLFSPTDNFKVRSSLHLGMILLLGFVMQLCKFSLNRSLHNWFRRSFF